MSEDKTKYILDFLKENPSLSSKEIHDGLKSGIGYATVKRILTKLIEENLVSTTGKGRGTKYALSPSYELLYPIDVDSYFEKEIDDRKIKETSQLDLIKVVLSQTPLFNQAEMQFLSALQNEYKANVSELNVSEYHKELERLAIDLSWKSSQIEGNTYTLLETERLLKDKETANGKAKDDATMLLNHKDALDFIISHRDYLTPLTLSGIEDIHSLLIKDLNVERNIRKRRVGISGTNYKPLDNEYQIREALNAMCELVNHRDNVFEKTLSVLLLISYIQPFGDGNKRTARIVGNAILMSYDYCPISFRTVDSVDYKKALLLFYEQTNIVMFKKIFIGQFEFAVKTYF
jgi:fido (protein-threonine AMPylation protein)/predicted transcriptional regulator